jgi:hydrogenase/urease accessory protein HupE
VKGWLRAAAVLLLWAPNAAAHELQPGFLELSTRDGREYAMLWKVPLQAGAALSIRPILPPHCTDQAPVSRRSVPGALLELRSLDCGEQGLAGETISIEGLSATRTDVVVRVAFEDGRIQNRIVQPQSASFTVSGSQGWTEVVWSYLQFGTEHIWMGIDHLLFVLALLLIVRGRRRLVWAITAFTVAHSITLAAATLGLVVVSQAPVEAVIALSIVFLASELVLQQRGGSGLTQRNPWIVAFVFGLLHGFGFAGALREVGLPAGDIPLALVSFNVGVELGQLAFVAGVLALALVGRRIAIPRPAWLRLAAAYGIGSVSAYWLLERLAKIFAAP